MGTNGSDTLCSILGHGGRKRNMVDRFTVNRLATPAPLAEYDQLGNLRFFLPCDVPHRDPGIDVFLAVLRQNLPDDESHVYIPQVDDAPLTVWVSWRSAWHAEAISRLFWPKLRPNARANPAYCGCDIWSQVQAVLEAMR